MSDELEQPPEFQYEDAEYDEDDIEDPDSIDEQLENQEKPGYTYYRRPTDGGKDKRIQRLTITSYEKSRLIGTRGIWISQGSPAMISTMKTDSIDIAVEEYKQNVLPTYIYRERPGKIIDVWHISELKLI